MDADDELDERWDDVDKTGVDESSSFEGVVVLCNADDWAKDEEGFALTSLQCGTRSTKKVVRYGKNFECMFGNYWLEWCKVYYLMLCCSFSSPLLATQTA